MAAKFISLCLVIVATYGCQSTPQTAPWEASADPNDESSPQALLWQARSAPHPQALALYLRATQGFIRLENWEQAELALANVSPALLEPDQVSSYHLAQAELALARGDLQRAAQLLAGVESVTDPVDVQSNFRRRLAMAKLCAIEGDFICSAHRLMDVQAPLAERQRVNDLIWSYMSQAPGLSARRQVKLQAGERLGWWELKSSMLESLSSADQRARLERWRRDWPHHPANEQPPLALLPLNDQQWQPEHVALLLPLSGPLARAGRAVRDGFVAAYLQSRSLADYGISIYDSEAAPLPYTYEQILLDGVDLIVGPLSKNSLSGINDLNPELPVLGLNYLEDHEIPVPNLLQLGLAIEDEADTLVTRLLTDGVERLVIFHNGEDWSLRAVERVKSQWRYPLTVQAFSDIKTITESVGRAMGVDASTERHAAMSKLLGLELEFLPRARADVEAVVALVSNIEASALVPALKFHFADDLPVYASSQSMRGNDADALEALSGFRVTELPWQLFDDPLRDAMADAFGLQNNPFTSLYALGVDAFRVSDRLPAFASGSSAHLLGSTGILSLGADGRFHRELAWGLVSRGRLIPLPLMAERLE